MKTHRYSQGIKKETLRRDVRPWYVKMHDALDYSLATYFVLLVLGIAPIAYPVAMLITYPIMWYVLYAALSNHDVLPFLLPFYSKKVDYHDPKAARIGFRKARGHYFIGTLLGDIRGILYRCWMSFDHLLQHIYIVGTTGAGKTETLVSLSATVIAAGSGVQYSDAKAAPKLAFQLGTIARYFGRDDDVRIQNFLNSEDRNEDRAFRRANTMMMFTEDGDQNTQIAVSMIPSGGEQNKIFSERAVLLWSAISPALVDLSKQGRLYITPYVYRDYLQWGELLELRFNPFISASSRTEIIAYLKSCSGYTEPQKLLDDFWDQYMAKPYTTDIEWKTIAHKTFISKMKTPDEVTRQHGFAQMYFTRILQSLSSVYGDIFMGERSEINMRDMILRRRIGIAMFPTLQKSMEEVGNLGKISSTAVKSAVSVGLGTGVEGKTSELLTNLPTEARTPYLVIADEYLYLHVSGYAATLAQARGLGVSMVIGMQETDALRELDRKESLQIDENTRIKMIGAGEGTGNVLDMLKKITGEQYVYQTSGATIRSGIDYSDDPQAQIQKEDQFSVRDIREQVEGETLVAYKNHVHRVSLFNHQFVGDKTLIKEFYVPRMVPCIHGRETPDTEEERRPYYVIARLLEGNQRNQSSLRNYVYDWEDYHIAQRGEVMEKLPNISYLQAFQFHRNNAPEALKKSARLCSLFGFMSIASIMDEHSDLGMLPEELVAAEDAEFANQSSINDDNMLQVKLSAGELSEDDILQMLPPLPALRFDINETVYRTYARQCGFIDDDELFDDSNDDVAGGSSGSGGVYVSPPAQTSHTSESTMHESMKLHSNPLLRAMAYAPTILKDDMLIEVAQNTKRLEMELGRSAEEAEGIAMDVVEMIAKEGSYPVEPIVLDRDESIAKMKTMINAVVDAQSRGIG